MHREAWWATVHGVAKSRTQLHTYPYIHTHTKGETMPFAATCIDLEIVILRKESQTEKEEYHMISLTCGILCK